MASEKSTRQAKHIIRLTAVIGLGAGGYRGFCQAQSIPVNPNLDWVLMYTPSIAGAIGMGSVMQKGMGEEFKARGESDLEASMLSFRGLGAGAVVGGIVGAVSTAAGYGIGYLLGYLIK